MFTLAGAQLLVPILTWIAPDSKTETTKFSPALKRSPAASPGSINSQAPNEKFCVPSNCSPSVNVIAAKVSGEKTVLMVEGGAIGEGEGLFAIGGGSFNRVTNG